MRHHFIRYPPWHGNRPSPMRDCGNYPISLFFFSNIVEVLSSWVDASANVMISAPCRKDPNSAQGCLKRFLTIPRSWSGSVVQDNGTKSSMKPMLRQWRNPNYGITLQESPQYLKLEARFCHSEAHIPLSVCHCEHPIWLVFDMYVPLIAELIQGFSQQVDFCVSVRVKFKLMAFSACKGSACFFAFSLVDTRFVHIFLLAVLHELLVLFRRELVEHSFVVRRGHARASKNNGGPKFRFGCNGECRVLETVVTTLVEGCAVLILSDLFVHMR